MGTNMMQSCAPNHVNRVWLEKQEFLGLEECAFYGSFYIAIHHASSHPYILHYSQG